MDHGSRTAEPYRAPAWLPGGNLQTIYAALVAHRPKISYRRVRWDTPDGDFIDLDWVDGPADGPLVVLFHGLEGSSRSHYARTLMHAVKHRGWRGIVVHFRGCSGELNRLGRAYHSGDSAEIGWILERLRGEHAGLLFAVGVSLGGNALLKWLGEQGAAAASIVRAAAAVSAPVDLMAAGNALDRGFNLLYVRYFLATMKPKSRAKVLRFPGLFDRARMERAVTLREFDDVVTAPLHGFRDTDDYWTLASSKPLLSAVAVPALLLNARNDPFLPADALPGPDEVAACVTLDFPATGGHLGFVSGPLPGNLGWLAARLLGYFDQHLVR
jgi:predicted alpha/beta-fold hydrolase